MSALDTLNQKETTQTEFAPQVKATQPKGKYSIPTPTGAVSLDPSILESMQDIIAQKEAKKTSFMEGLKDVMAYDVGYKGDLNKSLRERAAEREGNVADIFQMKTQLAQHKAAQDAQKRFEAMKNKSLGLDVEETAPGTGTTSGTQTTGGMIMPPKSDPTYTALQNAKTEEEWKKIYNKWAEETSKIRTGYEYSTALDAVTKFPIDGKMVDMTLRQAKKIAENNPALKQYIENLMSGNQAPVATTTPGAVTTPVVTPSAPAVKATTTPTETKPPVAAAPSTSAAPVAAAPSARSSGALPSSADITQKMEIEKAETLARTKGREKEFEKIGEKAGLQVDAIETAHRDYSTNKTSYEKIGKLVESNPFAFGVLQRPDILSGALNAIKQGATVGNYNVSLPGVENLVRQAGGTEADVTAANLAVREFARLQLNASRLIAGQGSVSDAERQLLAQVAGSASDDPRTIKELVKWGKARTDFDKEMGDAWKAYLKKNPGGSYRDFYINSPEHDRIMAAWEKKTQGLLNEFSSGSKPSGARAEIERRKKLKETKQ
jgi:hypothetical protein